MPLEKFPLRQIDVWLGTCVFTVDIFKIFWKDLLLWFLRVRSEVDKQIGPLSLTIEQHSLFDLPFQSFKSFQLLSVRNIAEFSLNYHQNADAEEFVDWFEHRLLNLTQNSVSIKAEIQDSMITNDIYFEEAQDI